LPRRAALIARSISRLYVCRADSHPATSVSSPGAGTTAVIWVVTRGKTLRVGLNSLAASLPSRASSRLRLTSPCSSLCLIFLIAGFWRFASARMSRWPVWQIGSTWATYSARVVAA
jgi:hypothetical protein